ncbi:MAG: ComEA family DNA-binding protein, partial [Phycisphaerales bacterium]
GSTSHSAQIGLRAAPSRAMAWSGVLAVMSELAAQREEILQGKKPSITEYWAASGPEADSPGTPRWGFRVLEMQTATGDAGEGWVACEPEMGKLDVNTATTEMLAKLPGVSAALAEAIVSARGPERFTSVPELLRVPGMTPELLFEAGAKEKRAADVTAPAAEAGAEERGATGESGSASKPEVSSEADAPPGGAARRALADYLTVFSFDPEVQLGFGPKASDVRGNQRINLNVTWSDELGSAIERRFDRSVADGVKGLLESGRTFAKPSDIVKTLRAFRVEPDGWAEVLDAFTTNPEDYRLGQVDLMTASEPVLACVPGISVNAAKEIVFRRSRLDEERRRTPVWPVLEGIVTQDEFEQAVDYLSARCLQWRVIVEGGIVPALEDASADAGGSGGGGRWEVREVAESGIDRAEFTRRVDEREGARTRQRVVLEAVIDISSRRPRVAMLRDVTRLPLARAMIAEARQTERGGGEAESRAEASESAAPAPAEGDAPASRPEDGEPLDFGGLELDDLAVSGPEDAPGNSSTRDSRTGDNTAAPDSSGGAAPAGGDGRVGRWTTGGKGGSQ